MEGFEISVDVADDCCSQDSLFQCFNCWSHLFSAAQSVTQLIVQFRDFINLGNRGFYIVLDPSEEYFLGRVVQDGVAGSGVFVTRLPDAPDIDHEFLSTESKTVITFFCFDEAWIRRKDARDVGVTLETEQWDFGK